MKSARLVVLGVAVAAGGLAALLSGGSDQPAPVAQAPTKQIDTVEVLVARADIGMGHVVRPADIGWETWPAAAASASFMRRADRPGAEEEFKGAIARAPFVVGEPIRENKLIKADGSGFLAAMLPAGMRAISVEISPETGAGGFILPNDRVDVVLTRRDPETEKVTGGQAFVSETILSNTRVLAIDQTIEEKNGEKVVVGRTATLELTPRQTETLALARQAGTLALALRSLADANQPAEKEEERRRGGITFVRFGITSNVSR